MKFFAALLTRLYYHLYHAFAWSYDLVAALVSLGRWNRWVRASEKWIAGKRVLELGSGPGHLQIALRAPGRLVIGLDESRPMLRQSSRRLRRAGETPVLIRALAQGIPLASGSLDSVAATFPAEYFFDPRTLEEILRVLAPGGRLTVLIGGWPSGRSLPERILAWVLRGEVGAQIEATWREQLIPPFERTGFRAETRIVEEHGGRLIYLTARKPPAEQNTGENICAD